MTGHDPTHDDELARRLADERPAPDGAFRLDLRRRLLERAGATPRSAAAPRRRRRSPGRRRVRALVAAYAGSGLLLLAVAAAGVAGFGPLAA